MAGWRITDVEALDSDLRFAIAAAASGGVWKTVNAGTTWTPIFDRYGSSSIGDETFHDERRRAVVLPHVVQDADVRVGRPALVSGH
jgi:hypothetical protein